MEKLQINLLSCGHRSYRFPFTKKSVEELLKIKNKDKIILSIHGENSTIELWKDYFKYVQVPFIIKLYEYKNSNYLDRVRNSHETDCPYSCKLDDDVLVPCHVWDYMIENLDKIGDEHPIISPILTNGIPSVDFFIKDFLNEEEKIHAYQLFLNQRVPINLWGLDYSSINDKLSTMTSWDDFEYWKFVFKADTKWEKNQVPWHYFNVRGVHPARFSYDYNIFIANCIFKNKAKFFEKNNYYFDTYSAPYFTNNTFISKTKYWRDTLPLFDDGWDEGQLSLRLRMDNKSILYVRNGFGIHMAYGMTENWKAIEDYYIKGINSHE